MMASLPPPLIAAAESGDAERVRAELAAFQAANPGSAAQGGAIPLTDKEGRTMLHIASGAGHAAVVRLLVDAGVRTYVCVFVCFLNVCCVHCCLLYTSPSPRDRG